MSRAVTRAMAFLPSESQLQDSIVEGLELRGYTVLQVGRWTRQTKCPNCGHWHTPKGGYGNTPGTPDLFVYSPKRRGWIGIELKAPGAKTLYGTIQPGRVKAGQKKLADAGMTYIAHSWEEAIKAVEGD